MPNTALPTREAAVPAIASAEPLDASEQLELLCRQMLHSSLSDSLLQRQFLLTHADTELPAPDVPLGHLLAGEETTRQLRQWQSDLLAIPEDSLSEQEQWLLQLLKAQLEQRLSLIGLEYYFDLCIPQTGIPQTLPRELTAFRIASLHDAETYLTLLEDIPRYFTELETFEQKKQQHGLSGTSSFWRMTAAFCRSFADTAEQNPLYTSYLERLTALELSPEEQTDLSNRCLEQIEQQVSPAYLHLADTLDSLQSGQTSNGRWASLTGGTRAYELAAARETGSRWTLDEMTRRMDDCLRLLETTSEQLQQNGRAVRLARRYFFPETSASDILTQLEERCAEEFPLFPVGETKFLSLSDLLKEYADPVQALSLPLDTDQAVVWLNPSAYTSSSLYRMIAHEVYPGRLYQQRFQQSLRLHPVQSLLSFPGYADGWGTYAELSAIPLVVEEEPDVTACLQLERLFSLMLCARASVGIHQENWTEYRLSQFLQSYGLDSRELAKSIYRAVLADPFGYLREGVGYLEFDDLRQTTEMALGDDFQPAEFHQLLLSAGPAPFSMLAEKVKRWIAHR